MTHERAIESQKKVFLWEEHLGKWMFGNVAIVMWFYCQKMMCLSYKSVLIFLYSQKSWKWNVLLICFKNSPKGKFQWSFENICQNYKSAGALIQFVRKTKQLVGYCKETKWGWIQAGQKRKITSSVSHAKPLFVQPKRWSAHWAAIEHSWWPGSFGSLLRFISLDKFRQRVMNSCIMSRSPIKKVYWPASTIVVWYHFVQYSEKMIKSRMQSSDSLWEMKSSLF